MRATTEQTSWFSGSRQPLRASLMVPLPDPVAEPNSSDLGSRLGREKRAAVRGHHTRRPSAGVPWRDFASSRTVRRAPAPPIMMRALLARVVVFAVTAATLPALAGCGGSSSSGSASGGLRAALAAVKAGPRSRQYFEWGDTKRLRQLAHLRPDGTPSSRSSANDRFAVVSGTGLGALA